MDREEIAKIKKAINLIHNHDEYYEGMNILARLAGYHEFIIPSESISISDFLKED